MSRVTKDDVLNLWEAAKRDPMISDNPDSLAYIVDDVAANLMDQYGLSLGEAYNAVYKYTNAINYD